MKLPEDIQKNFVVPGIDQNTQNSEIMGFGDAIQPATKQSTQLPTVSATIEILKEKGANLKQKETVLTEGTIPDGGKFQLIGVNLDNKLLNELYLKRHELTSYSVSTTLHSALMKSKNLDNYEAYKECRELLYRGECDAYYLKWIEHESWKTFKLISTVRYKATDSIRSLIKRSIIQGRIPIGSRHSFYLNRKGILTVLDYLFCNLPTPVFADYYKLSRSGMLFKPYSNTLDRRVATFTIYDYSSRKFNKIPLVDNSGYGISRYVTDFLDTLCGDMYRTFRRYGNNRNLYKYINQAYIREDEDAAKLYLLRLNDSISMQELDVPHLMWTATQGTQDFDQIIEDYEQKFNTFIAAKQAYLKEGRLSLICRLLQEDDTVDRTVIKYDDNGTPTENLDHPDADTILLQSLAVPFYDKLQLSEEEAVNYMISLVTFTKDRISTISSNNLKMHTKNLISTKLIADGDKKHYVTTSIPHVKSDLLEYHNLQELYSAIDEMV